MQRVNPSVEPNRRNSIHAVAEAAAKKRRRNSIHAVAEAAAKKRKRNSIHAVAEAAAKNVNEISKMILAKNLKGKQAHPKNTIFSTRTQN